MESIDPVIKSSVDWVNDIPVGEAEKFSLILIFMRASWGWTISYSYGTIAIIHY